jgi:hypothetical protein
VTKPPAGIIFAKASGRDQRFILEVQLLGAMSARGRCVMIGSGKSGRQLKTVQSALSLGLRIASIGRSWFAGGHIGLGCVLQR